MSHDDGGVVARDTDGVCACAVCLYGEYMASVHSDTLKGGTAARGAGVVPACVWCCARAWCACGVCIAGTRATSVHAAQSHETTQHCCGGGGAATLASSLLKSTSTTITLTSSFKRSYFAFER